MKSFLAQTRIETVLTLRRGESMLVSIFIPAALLIFFTLVPVLPHSRDSSPVDFYLPGTISIAVAATAMVSLGIATAFERYYGVLKRLGGTPLTRATLLAAKGTSVLGVELVQAAVIFGASAIFLGWDAKGNVPALVAVIVLGTFSFASLGLMLAGILRAEMNLAAANGLFLLFVLLSGVVVPIGSLPGALEALARALPAAALTDAVRWALEGGPPPGAAFALLATWGAGSAALAGISFKWE